MTNPLEDKGSITAQAADAIEMENAAGRNGLATVIFTTALILSAVFTIIYMVAALGESMMTKFEWPPLVAYSLGFLLGLAAIAPGEAAIFAWKTRLQADTKINNMQIIVAWVAGLLAAVSAAVSTVSFFAYMLQGLMPGWYNADTAAGVNVINIATSWAIFGVALFVYDAASSLALRNRKRASAWNLVAIAQDEMISGIAQGIRNRTKALVHDMSEANVFFDDAVRMVGEAMGLDEGRLSDVRRLAPPPATNQPEPAQASAEEQDRPVGFPTNREPWTYEYVDEQTGKTGRDQTRLSFDQVVEAVRDYERKLEADTRRKRDSDARPTQPANGNGRKE